MSNAALPTRVTPGSPFAVPDGEVLIHLARYDGLYRLHSPALSSPLIGRSFVELTKAFSSQVPLQITLQRNNGPRVFVHPAAMLAVVIGTIFAGLKRGRVLPANDR